MPDIAGVIEKLYMRHEISGPVRKQLLDALPERSDPFWYPFEDKHAEVVGQENE